MLLQKLSSTSLALVLACSLIITGCDSGGNGTGTDSGTGTMEVRMHDAPIDSADEVNVFIERVEVNREGSSDGWQTISEPQKSFNLLDLINGAYEVLGEAELETGTYQQIRLILSQDGHNVVIDGDIHEMMVPSGAQTGVKLNVNAEIKPDITYILLLDFDASRSVVKAGQNNPAVSYLLKPVVKATNQAITGNIGGTVSPAEAQPVIYAIADSDTLSSTIADTTDGTFKLIGLEEGSYTVSVNPRNDTYQPKDIADVSVTVDQTTDLGTIEVNQ